MISLAKDMLLQMADRAQLQFAINGGHFRIPLWLSQSADGKRVWFETPCRAGRNIGDDKAVIAMLVEEQRADFQHDHIIAFATAYVASMMQTRWLSAIQFEPERKIDGIVVEAHDRDGGHLRTYFEILTDHLGPLAPVEVAPTSIFATLLT